MLRRIWTRCVTWASNASQWQQKKSATNIHTCNTIVFSLLLFLLSLSRSVVTKQIVLRSTFYGENEKRDSLQKQTLLVTTWTLLKWWKQICRFSSSSSEWKWKDKNASQQTEVFTFPIYACQCGTILGNLWLLFKCFLNDWVVLQVVADCCWTLKYKR